MERGSFEVSGVLPLLSPSFEDLSVSGGRTYSNKAPGAAVLGALGYAAARPFAGPPSATSMRPAVTAMRLVVSTLPALVLAVVLARAAERLGAGPERSPRLAFALLFATPVAAYGLLLFSHVLVALCLFGAWAALFASGARGREALAGALIGLAIVSEYPAAIPALVLAACAARRLGGRGLLRLALGGLPFALLLAVYDAAAFGAPLALSSAHEKYGGFASLAGAGVFGVGLPSPGRLAALLFDPGKGLFVFSPVLLLGAVRLAAARRALPRDAFLALALVPASVVLLYAGYPNWHGGWTVGPRYLVAAVPFLVAPLAFGRGDLPEGLALGWSALAVCLTTLAFPFAPPEFPLPWGTLAAPLVARGLVAPNLAHEISRPLAVALPFALVAAALIAALPRRALLAAAVAGAAALGVGLAAHRRESDLVAMERGYFEEVYFEREGSLAAAVPGRGPSRALVARAGRERALGPSSWPF